MRAMQRFSLRDGETDRPSQLRCPILFTGPADSFCSTPEQNANRIFDGLSQLGPTEKHLWVGRGGANGGLQAKIASLALLHHKIFSWLDEQFGIYRQTAPKE